MICRSCKQDKPEERFSWKKKDVKRSYKCKSCHKKYVRQHYLDNEKKYVDRARMSSKIYRKRNQQLLLKYFEDKCCVDCGNSDIRVFEFDHLRDKSYNVSEMIQSGLGWKRILLEIDKCEIVCANCHKVRTWERLGTYRTKKQCGSF